MSEEVILEVRNLYKAFGGVQAIADVSFDLQRGEVLGIIGPNGSGKTTLVNLITGFVKKDSTTYFLKVKRSPNGRLTRSQTLDL